MKRTIFIILFILSLALFVGTAGACDNNLISFTQAFIQAIIAVLMASISYHMIQKADKEG